MTSPAKVAGFGVRFVANLVDMMLLTLASWIFELACLGGVYWIGKSIHPGMDHPGFFEEFDAFTLQMLNVAVYAGMALPYYVLGHRRYGTTVGKKLFGIYVVDARTRRQISPGQAIGRCLAYMLSYVIFFGGFIMAAFHPRKQALHDLIAGTMSIRSKAAPFLIALMVGPTFLPGTPDLFASDEVPPRFHFQLGASYVRVNPSANGGELGGAFLFEPFPDRFIQVGPRLGVLGAQSTEASGKRRRLDLNTGFEGAIWFANAIGSGLGVDFVGPSRLDDHRSPHFRIDPFFSIRFNRWREKGAWALRVSLPYSTEYQWGLKAGLTLQFSGVPVAWD